MGYRSRQSSALIGAELGGAFQGQALLSSSFSHSSSSSKGWIAAIPSEHEEEDVERGRWSIQKAAE